MIQTVRSTYPYRGDNVEYAYWKNGETTEVHTIIFLGIAQVDKLGVWVAEYCPVGTVVVQGVPHWLSNPDGSDLVEFIHFFEVQVLADIRRRYTVKTCHIIADSQAAPGIARILADTDDSSFVAKVSFLQPLGLNSWAFGGTKSERIKTFNRRVFANARYQLAHLVHDKRLRYNHRTLGRLIGFGVTTDASRAHFNSGIAHDAVDDFRRLPARYSVQIIIGDKDKIFPAYEVARTLREHEVGIPIHTVGNVPHSPIATKQGLKLLARALEL